MVSQLDLEGAARMYPAPIDGGIVILVVDPYTLAIVMLVISVITIGLLTEQSAGGQDYRSVGEAKSCPPSLIKEPT